MSSPHRCNTCGGVEPDVRFQVRPSGNKRPICEDCRSLENAARLYGISVEQYHAMLHAQDGKCAICKTASWDKEHKKFRRLVVDHDHKTGKVRGLLCANCNLVLGHAKDSVQLLAASIAYLS